MGSPTEWNYTSRNTRCKRRSDWPALNFGRGAGASRQNVIIIQPLPPWFIPVSRAAAFLFVGTWLSLVEHSLGVRGVGSSNLPVPTNQNQILVNMRALCIAPAFACSLCHVHVKLHRHFFGWITGVVIAGLVFEFAVDRVIS